MPTDTITLKKAQKGNMQAFEEVLRQHEGIIYQVCLRMCGNPQDAMDLSQETAVRIWKNIGNFNGQSALSTWVYRIATNACLDHLRKRKDEISIDALGEEGFAPAAPTDLQPDVSLHRKQSLQEIGDAIAALPADQRSAVILRDVQDLSYEEVAKVLGCNLNTVKSRISRGRRSLQKALGQNLELFTKDHV